MHFQIYQTIYINFWQNSIFAIFENELEYIICLKFENIHTLRSWCDLHKWVMSSIPGAWLSREYKMSAS